MEISSRHHHQDREKPSPSPMNSPRSNVSNCMSSSNNNSNHSNGILQIPTPPLTPKTIPRSDSNPYPTTFVQADTTTFKHVVQLLTGSSETKQPPPTPSSSSKPPQQQQQQQQPQDPVPPPSFRNFNIPPIKTAPKKQGFKLYERRNSLKNNLMLNTIMPNFAHNSAGFSPRYNKQPEILSPSLLDFPSLALSPVTPLNDDDPFDKSSPSLGNSPEEDKAIAEKGFYLHPSPITTPRDSEPQLLPLFPVTSPRVSQSPS